MRLLVCLAIVVAFALPCLGSDPTAPRMEKRKPRAFDRAAWMNLRPARVPPPLLDGGVLRALLFPLDTYAGQVADRIKHHRMMLENGGQGRPRGPYWPLLD